MARRNASGETEERIVPGWLLPRGEVTPHATLLLLLTSLTPATTALQIRA